MPLASAEQPLPHTVAAPAAIGRLAGVLVMVEHEQPAPDMPQV